MLQPPTDSRIFAGNRYSSFQNFKTPPSRSYTFLFRASKIVPKLLLTKRSTIGVRWPDQIIATQIVSELGNPILSSSLYSGEDHLFDNAWEIHEEFGKQVDLVIDGREIFAEHSTIIDFTTDVPEVIWIGKGQINWLDQI